MFANVVLSLLSNRSLLAAYDDVVATKAYDAEIAFPADPLIEPNTVRLPVIIEDPDTMASKMNPGFMAMMAKKKDGAKGSMPAALAKHAAKPASKAHAGLKGGGYVKAADGVAQRGKTKGTQVTMKNGGKC